MRVVGTLFAITAFILGGYYACAQEAVRTVTMLVAGDLMLDRQVRAVIKKKGKEYPFLKIKDMLAGNDITLLNLEGPFTTFAPVRLEPKGIRFTFDPALVPHLKQLGVSLVSLSNNHGLDFGKNGFLQSKKYLAKNGIDFFGDPFNKDQISLVKEVNGMKLAFVGYHELFKPSLNTTLAEIKKLRSKADFLVVMPHWGIEYKPKFSRGQQEKAHAFINAGADVVLGAHPHVVQPFEFYKNKLIFYSLGNFLFDQTFSQKTQQGLAVRLVVTPTSVDYSFFPTEIKNFQIQLAGKAQRDKVLAEVLKLSVLSKEQKKEIAAGGQLTIPRARRQSTEILP